MLLLRQDGAAVTGTLEGTAIEDGVWAEGQPTFTARLTRPIKVKVTCTARVEGETMTGAARTGLLPIPMPLTGTRVTV
jgi:hypothetical protein